MWNATGRARAQTMPAAVVVLIAAALTGPARADDACDEKAKEATSQANELFDFIHVKLIGFHWHEKLPEEALKAHAEAVADILSDDFERVGSGNAVLAALNQQHGKTQVDGIKRTRFSFGIWNGEARLLASEGWYQGDSPARETQVALPPLSKRMPYARDVRMEGMFIPRHGDAIHYTGTLDDWLRKNTPDGCGDAAVARLDRL